MFYYRIDEVFPVDEDGLPIVNMKYDVDSYDKNLHICPICNKEMSAANKVNVLVLILKFKFQL